MAHQSDGPALSLGRLGMGTEQWWGGGGTLWGRRGHPLPALELERQGLELLVLVQELVQARPQAQQLVQLLLLRVQLREPWAAARGTLTPSNIPLLLTGQSARHRILCSILHINVKT